MAFKLKVKFEGKLVRLNAWILRSRSSFELLPQWPGGWSVPSSGRGMGTAENEAEESASSKDLEAQEPVRRQVSERLISSKHE